MSHFLVIAGSHQQFLHWLSERTLPPPPYRPIFQEQHLRGITARDVQSFDHVGTYWDNPAWGSASYRLLMAEGLRFDMHWATPWEADFRRAQALRTRRRAGTTAVEEARARHERLQRRMRGEE